MIQTLIQVRRTLWFIAASMLAMFAIPAGAQVQLLHPTNTVWRYQTDLLEQQNAGAAWVNPGFDDSAWQEGKGLFGNDSGYPYAMNTTGAGLGGGLPAATYFRTHFTWSGHTAGIALGGTNYIDDGSIIYLNGVEIARFNMPASANAGTPEASAPAANPGGFPNVNSGEPVLVQLQIDLDALTNGNLNPLVQGDNVIAVQAHQQGTGSSDRVFGLALYVLPDLPPCFSGASPIQPTNRVILEGRSTTFIAIVQCSMPPVAFQWYRDIGRGEEVIAGATGASYTLNNAIQPDTGLYYVKATNIRGTATSRQAVLIVSGDPSPPKLISGRLGANNLEIIVTADEPVCPDDSCAGNATLTVNWEIYEEGNQSQQLGIAGITVNGNTLTFTLDGSTPWVTDTRYVVGLLPFGGGQIGDLYGNLLYGGDPFSSVTTPPVASEEFAPRMLTQPVSVQASEGEVVRFNIAAIGAVPLSYQWFKDGTPLGDGGSFSGAITSELTINNADPCNSPGNYSCRVTNSYGNATSSVARLTMFLDVVRPVLTRALGPNPTNVVLTFSKSMGTNATEIAHYSFSHGIAVTDARLSNNVIMLTTSPRLVGLATLTITGITDNRACPSMIDSNPMSVTLTTVRKVVNWSDAWEYNTNNLDSAPDWTTTGGTGWRTGNGLFGTEISTAATSAFPVPIATVIPPTSVNDQYLTSYYRKTVNLPVLQARQSYAIGHYTDDGAIFYLDGAEIGRFNMPAGPVTYSTLTPIASIEGVLLSLPFSATAGEHVLAVEVHQSSLTSADVVFGASVIVVPTAAPELSIQTSGTNAIITWAADSSWRLNSSVNPDGTYFEIPSRPFRRYSVPLPQPPLTPRSEYFRLQYVPQP